MIRRHHIIRSFATVLLVGVLAAGCGGGEAAVDPGVTTPTPATTPGASTVAADPNAPVGTTPAIDPVTGLPVDPAAAGTGATGATATVPNLSDGDIGIDSGFADLTGIDGFDAKAVDTKPVDPDKDKVEGTTETTKTEAAQYTGAVVSMDGLTYSVTTSGTFPKGGPVFKLVSVTGDKIWIDLIAGEFTGGASGTYIGKGKTIKMVNQSEQTTYAITYVRPIADTTGIAF